MSARITSFALLLVCLGVWELSCRLFEISELVIPRPFAVGVVLFDG